MAMYLCQGKKSLFKEVESHGSEIDQIKDCVNRLCNIKNINFLFGSGTSSGAIPTMKKMEEGIAGDLLFHKLESLYDKIKNVKGENLEEILGVLYSGSNFDKGTGECDEDLDNLIAFIEKGIFSRINVDLGAPSSIETLETYKNFYEKISKRNRDLPRVNVFTTNNDILNEVALDQLNIDYNNGFGGGIRRLFNPSRFNYIFSRSSDTAPDKYEPINNMVYLFKLHGSINWRECEDSSYFLNIEEFDVSSAKDTSRATLVYPTPLKQNKSLGSPYADIMREFKSRLSMANNVLFVIGYSFSDEHVNNIIYHALSANSSLSVVLFGDFSGKPIYEVGDNRVFSIFGKNESDEEKIHYFKYLVGNILPDLNSDSTDVALKEFSRQLKKMVER